MSEEALHVLFVDGEPAALQAIANLLRKDRHRWGTRFARNFAEARAVLHERAFDMVICEARLEDADALALLDWVRAHDPSAARVVLSAESRDGAIERLLPVAHQFIGKPCDAATLRATLARAEATVHLLADPACRRAIGAAERLPLLPGTVAAVEAAIAASGGADPVPAIVAIVERDPVAAARVLQAASSAFFRAARAVASVHAAVAHLGVEATGSVLRAADAIAAQDAARGEALDHQALGARAERRSRIVRRLLAHDPARDIAVVAALMLDIGSMLLTRMDPQGCSAVRAHAGVADCPVHAAERHLLGVDHGEVAAYLLGTWGLPEALVDTLACHHRPLEARAAAPAALAAVSVADLIVDAADPATIDTGPLEAAGLPHSPESLFAIAAEE